MQDNCKSMSSTFLPFCFTFWYIFILQQTLNMNPCFDASEIQSKDKGVYISLRSNINRGQLKNVIYFCSLVNKKGRTFSFMSRSRVLILLGWKDKLHSLGYIESMRSLPPWNQLPQRKFEKQLNVIKTILLKEKCLQIGFYDEEQSWQLELQNKNLAKKWWNLLQSHKKQQQIQRKSRGSNQGEEKTSEKSIAFQLKANTQKKSSSKHSLEQQSVYELTIQQEKEDKYSLKKELKEPYSQSLNNIQLFNRFNLEKEQWELKQKRLVNAIQILKNQNTELKNQNQKLRAINRQIKEESARLRIGKSLLIMLKEQYQKKHLQFTQLLAKKSFQTNKLMEKCADIILMKNSLQKELSLIKKRQNYFQQTGKQRNIQYDFQFSSSSNQNTREIVQNESNLKPEHQIQRHNTQNLLIVNEISKKLDYQTQLIRQNTIC